MTDLPNSAEIVIVGGGVMGASCAYHLAQRGVSDVVLLEKLPFFGAGATGRCAGGVRYQFSTEVNIQLSLQSLPMLDRFEEEIGIDSGRRKIGYLFLLTKDQDVAMFRRNVALQRRLGVETEWLTTDNVRRLVPQMRVDDVLAGVINWDDGIADPHSVVSGYIGAARRSGARAFEDCGVTAIEFTDGWFTVTTTGGAIRCRRLINAGGPWAARISAMLGVALPITPLRRQWLTTSPLPQLGERFPFVIDFAQSLYFHPEGAGLLTGMSNPHETPGYDQSIDEAWELVHMEHAVERLPLLEQAGLQAHWAGLYENTPDAHPIIGPVAQLPGYTVVAGFSGHGFMHGPIAGKLVAEQIVDGQAHSVDISMLDYERFAEGRLIQEYNVI